jgi:hypothetical protein
MTQGSEVRAALVLRRPMGTGSQRIVIGVIGCSGAGTFVENADFGSVADHVN